MDIGAYDDLDSHLAEIADKDPLRAVWLATSPIITDLKVLQTATKDCPPTMTGRAPKRRDSGRG